MYFSSILWLFRLNSEKIKKSSDIIVVSGNKTINELVYKQ